MRVLAEGPVAARSASTTRESLARRWQIGPEEFVNRRRRRRQCRLVLPPRRNSLFVDDSRGASTRARAEPGRRLPASDASADVAVFRFTLGIPGLDDAQVPRIIGVLALLGLAANRVFGGGLGAGAGAGGVVPPSQGRAEAVAALLAFAACAVPAVERLIADAEPGRGRRALAALPGSAQCFRVETSLEAKSSSSSAAAAEASSSSSSSSPQQQQQAAAASADPLAAELAWASYALLRNANCCTVVVLKLGEGGGGGGGGDKKATATTTTTTRALAVRGALPPSVASPPSGDPLSAAAEAFSPTPALVSEAIERGGAVYVSDSTSMTAATAATASGGGSKGGPWGVLPAGAGCALAQPILSTADGADGAGDGGGGGSSSSPPPPVVAGLLLLAGDRPRALSVRDRAWAREVARKLSRVL